MGHKMTTFFTADLHLFHENIIKYCDRPFKNAEKMWRAIKRNWNAVVQPGDEVWVLGDLTLKKSNHIALLAKMIGELNGTKHMVVAPTHDLMLPREYEEIGFTTVHYPAFQLPNGWFLGHDPALATVWPKGSVYLCGHVHKLMTSQMSRTGVLMINVGVDVRDFTPVSEEQILEIISNGEPGPEDSGESKEEGRRKHLQDASGSPRVQQGRNMRNGQNESAEVREERWQQARRASIDGSGKTEGDS